MRKIKMMTSAGLQPLLYRLPVQCFFLYPWLFL